MQGKNELHLCEAELVVAVQEYLHKRWGYYTPKVVGIGYNNHTYKVSLEGLWGVVEDTVAAKPDPCPQCVPGAICRTPSCGRAKQAAQGLPYACPVCGITGVGGVVCTNYRCPTKVSSQ